MSHPPDLSSAERKRLRGRAMQLEPAVRLGRAGVSPTVVAATHAALDRDGLIKVRVEAPDKATRMAWVDDLAAQTSATVCGTVGHTASLYRPKATSQT
jgi:RNA-binding protein